MQFLNKAWTLWRVINYYGLDILTVWVQFIFLWWLFGWGKGWSVERTTHRSLLCHPLYKPRWRFGRSEVATRRSVMSEMESGVLENTTNTQTNKHAYSILVRSVPAAVNVADSWRKHGVHEKSWTAELIVEVVLVLGYLSVRAHTCVCVRKMSWLIFRSRWITFTRC